MTLNKIYKSETKTRGKMKQTKSEEGRRKIQRGRKK
jgi:hypothetical protein